MRAYPDRAQVQRPSPKLDIGCYDGVYFPHAEPVMSTPPSADALKLEPDQVNAFLCRAFEIDEKDMFARVVEARPGYARLVRRFDPASLRPGRLISGPTLMALADMAAYAQILAHIGEVAMAVTSSLTIHFLRGAKPGDLVAETHLLRLGRRSATCEVRLWTEGPDRIAAHATVAYTIPSSS
jgi:uncharacterized protein (TIGR00369 family)